MAQPINHLFQRCLEGQATRSEQQELYALISDERNDEALMREIETAYERFVYQKNPFSPQVEARMLSLITSKDLPKRKPVKMTAIKRWRWVAVAAAAAIVICIFGIHLYRVQQLESATDNAVILAQKISPGNQGATLTLSDGRKIALNDQASGTLAQEAGTRIIKTVNGGIQYQPGDGAGSLNYNSLGTGKGQIYSLNLPDGTVVWLNAASFIRYPSNFAAKGNRSVELKGEAYFEVAKDKSRPFVVTSGSQTVEVLGTHFNVNAYEDEPNQKTTLIEGSIKVAVPGVQKLINPGEQASFTKGLLQVATANTADAIAWKEGKFRFNETPMEELLRQLGRWYDLQLEFPTGVPQRQFSGGINRNVPLSSVLQLLKDAKINFRLNGRKLIVYN
ncbi:FecR family protein [Pedobacter paludis]|nr:FecR domain-containing protein [Pedobacter paludis]